MKAKKPDAPRLEWKGKDKIIKSWVNVPDLLLRHEKDFSYGEENADNMLIQGDNLDALKSLLPSYKGKVKCVFIDPPYNTKQKFSHYGDKLTSTQWLEMMYPRLELLRELLAEDGSLWVIINDNEAHYLKVVMDEIFGRKNFVANVVWQRKYSPTTPGRGFAVFQDNILVFKKSDLFKTNLFKRNEEQLARYKHEDERGAWGPWLLSACGYKPSGYGEFSIKNPNTNVEYWPPVGRHWMTNRDKIETWLKEGRIYFGKDGKGAPQLKVYLSEVANGIMPNTWWSHKDVGISVAGKNEIKALFKGDIFSTPKPERLIQRVLQIATNENDLVLDCFLGSGTTAAVAHKMGRRYIGVEMGEHAKTHCVTRLQKVIDGEQGGISKDVNWQGGGGYRFYSLGDVSKTPVSGTSANKL